MRAAVQDRWGRPARDEALPARLAATVRQLDEDAVAARHDLS